MVAKPEFAYIYLKLSSSILFMAIQSRKYLDGNFLVKLLYERSMMLNLRNSKFVLGLSITLQNLSVRRMRTYNSGRAPNQKGKVSLV